MRRAIHLLLLIAMFPPPLADGETVTPHNSPAKEIVAAPNFTKARAGAIRAFAHMFCFTDDTSGISHKTSGLVRVPEVEGMWTERISLDGCAERKLYLNPTYTKTADGVRMGLLANGESLCGYALQARIGPLVLAAAAKAAGLCPERAVGYVGLTDPPAKSGDGWREAWMSSGCGIVVSVPVKLTPMRGGAVSVEVGAGRRIALTGI